MAETSRMAAQPGARWVRRVCWTVVGAVLALVLAALGFDLLLYPGHGLAGIGPQDHETALRQAATLYARAEDMRLEAQLQSKTTSLEQGGQVAAFGLFALADAKGREFRLYLALLRPGPTASWERYEGPLLLLDSKNRFAALPAGAKNMDKVRFEARRLLGEQGRRIREYFRRD